MTGGVLIHRVVYSVSSALALAISPPLFHDAIKWENPQQSFPFSKQLAPGYPVSAQAGLTSGHSAALHNLVQGSNVGIFVNWFTEKYESKSWKLGFERS